jgi:single-stranded DNA-binding protein
VFAWGKLSRFAGTLEKGQLVTLEGILRYREVESEQHGKQRLAEVQASILKRLSRVEASDDPAESDQPTSNSSPCLRGRNDSAIQAAFCGIKSTAPLHILAKLPSLTPDND